MTMSKMYSEVVYGQKFRFHVDFGPESLFERGRFKTRDVHKLYMDGRHFNKRKSERSIPEEVLGKLQVFDINERILKTAEVRPDRGKFMNSTWEINCNEKQYWVTIGVGNYIITIVQKRSSGIDLCVRDGQFYDFVRRVNQKLMDDETRLKEPMKWLWHDFFAGFTLKSTYNSYTMSDDTNGYTPY